MKSAAASCLVALLLLVLPVPADAADNWPSFRRDAALTGVAAAPLPADLAVLWTFEAGDGIESTAALVDGVVYISSLDGHLYALNFTTGELLWKYDAGEEIKSSPSVRDGVVYFGDESGMFHALKAGDGKVLWTFEADAGIIASASFAADMVIVGSQDNFLYALNVADGALGWKVETGAYVYATVAIAEVDGRTAALVAGCDGLMRALDVRDGSQIRAVEIDSYVGASPVVADGLAYVGTFENQVLAVNLMESRVDWTYEHPQRHFPFYSSAAYGSGRLIVGGRDKMVHALDPASGKALWTYSAGSRVDSSPVMAGLNVYFGNLAGELTALTISEGEKVWEYATGSSITASPAVAQGRLVIGTLDGLLYCFAATGREGTDNE